MAKVNHHFIARSITKPWEVKLVHGKQTKRHLLYYDHDEQKYGHLTSKNLFSKDHLNSPEIEDLFAEFETEFGQIVHQRKLREMKMKKGEAGFEIFSGQEGKDELYAIFFLFVVSASRVAKKYLSIDIADQDIKHFLDKKNLFTQFEEVFNYFDLIWVHPYSVYFSESCSFKFFLQASMPYPIQIVVHPIHYSTAMCMVSKQDTDIVRQNLDRVCDGIMFNSLSKPSIGSKTVLPPNWIPSDFPLDPKYSFESNMDFGEARSDDLAQLIRHHSLNNLFYYKNIQRRMEDLKLKSNLPDSLLHFKLFDDLTKKIVGEFETD